MLKIFLNRLKIFTVFIGLLFLTKSISFGPLMGSLKGKLLASQVVLPLSGAFTDGIGLLLIFLTSSILSFSFKFSLYSLATVYHIPSFFAALSFNTGLFSGYLGRLSYISRYINFIIPAICSILFIAHPVGALVPFYVLYWSVPVIIEFWGKTSIFLRALAATFIAHSVGTVFFIYSIPSDANLWLNLAQIVWLERIVLALSITVNYKLINLILNRFKLLNIKFRRIPA